MVTAVARLTSKGQITVPKAVRDHLGVESGDSLIFDLQDDLVLVRRARRRRVAEFRGRFPVPEAKDAGEERARAWRAMTARLVPDS